MQKQRHAPEWKSKDRYEAGGQRWTVWISMRYTNGLGKRKQSIERELKRIKWNDQIKGADADVAAAVSGVQRIFVPSAWN